MNQLKYTLIKSGTQYDRYCRILEQLLDKATRSKAVND